MSKLGQSLLMQHYDDGEYHCDGDCGSEETEPDCVEASLTSGLARVEEGML